MYPGNLNHPLGERKLILGDTPIFHWTMIIGGRVLSVILRIQFWKQEYPLNVLECKTRQPMSARPKACLPIAYRPTCALGSTTVKQWHVFESSAVNSCGDIFIFFLLEGQRKKMVVELQVIWSKSPAKTVILKFPFPRWERSSHRQKNLKKWEAGSYFTIFQLCPGQFLVKPPTHRRKGSWRFLAVSDKDVFFKWLVTKYILGIGHDFKTSRYKCSHDEIAITCFISFKQVASLGPLL